MIDDIHLHGLNVSVTFKHKAITILHVQIIKLLIQNIITFEGSSLHL